MPQLKLTPVVLIAAFLIWTLIPPLTILSELPDGQLLAGDTWQKIADAAAHSAADAALKLIAIIAAAVGVPALATSRNKGDGDAPPSE